MKQYLLDRTWRILNVFALILRTYLKLSARLQRRHHLLLYTFVWLSFFIQQGVYAAQQLNGCLKTTRRSWFKPHSRFPSLLTSSEVKPSCSSTDQLQTTTHIKITNMFHHHRFNYIYTAPNPTSRLSLTYTIQNTGRPQHSDDFLAFGSHRFFRCFYRFYK